METWAGNPWTYVWTCPSWYLCGLRLESKTELLGKESSCYDCQIWPAGWLWRSELQIKDFAGYREMVIGLRARSVLLEDPSSPMEARGKLLSLFFLTWWGDSKWNPGHQGLAASVFICWVISSAIEGPCSFDHTSWHWFCSTNFFLQNSFFSGLPGHQQM